MPYKPKSRYQTKNKFYLSLFEQKEDVYEEKEINGFWLIKMWNGDEKKWKVHLYSKESYNNYKNNGVLF